MATVLGLFMGICLLIGLAHVCNLITVGVKKLAEPQPRATSAGNASSMAAPPTQTRVSAPTTEFVKFAIDNWKILGEQFLAGCGEEEKRRIRKCESDLAIHYLSDIQQVVEHCRTKAGFIAAYRERHDYFANQFESNFATKSVDEPLSSHAKGVLLDALRLVHCFHLRFLAIYFASHFTDPADHARFQGSIGTDHFRPEEFVEKYL